jgi:hypothetical protein
LPPIDVFAQPFSYWVGMETDPRTTPQALAEFNRFYSTTHVGEVVAAHPGFLAGSRYELVDGAALAAGQAGPRWLAVYGMADEGAAQQYLKDDARPWLHRSKYSPWPSARRRAKMVWRMLWQRTASAGSLTTPAELLVLLRSHQSPEVLLPDGFARATGFELFRAFAPPESEVPRFCVVHEGDTDSAASPFDVPDHNDTQALAPLRYRYIPPPD